MKALAIGIFVYTVLTVILACNAQLYAPLDPANRKNLDHGVRKELILLANEKAEKVVPLTKQLSTSCETKINHVVSKCQKCQKTLKKKSESNAYKLLTILFIPDMIFTEYLKLQEKWMKDAVGFMGKHAKIFFKGLGKLTNDVSKSIGKGIENVSKMTVKGLKHLTKQLENSLKHITESTLKGIQEIGKGIDNLVDDTDKILKGAADGIQDTISRTTKITTKTVENLLKDTSKAVDNVITAVTSPFRSVRIRIGGGWGKKKKRMTRLDDIITEDIFKRSLLELREKAIKSATMMTRGDALLHLEGKRQKRILYEKVLDLGSCPSCDRIDKKRNQDDILNDVCPGTKASQTAVIKELEKLKRLFEFVTKNSVITNMKYNPMSYKIRRDGLVYTNVNVESTMNGVSRTHTTKAYMSFANVTAMAPLLAKEIYELY